MNVTKYERSLLRKNSPDEIAQRWQSLFSLDRNIKDDIKYVEKCRDIDADGSDLEIFLQYCDDSIPSCEYEDVHDFCEKPLACSYEEGSPPGLAKAWLDDREISSESTRSHKKWLTADELYTALAQPRFGLLDMPHADRRLIYIADLDPKYILALVKNVSYHQVEHLRDAIWKYLALHASVEVKLPVSLSILILTQEATALNHSGPCSLVSSGQRFSHVWAGISRSVLGFAKGNVLSLDKVAVWTAQTPKEID